MTTHNSYAHTLDPDWSITTQLEEGVRGLELDIHDQDIWKELVQDKTSRSWDKFLSRFKISFRFHFKIGHWWAGHQVSRIGENPKGNNFHNWLSKIAEWSRKKQKEEGHAPITVFLDLKTGLHERRDNYPPEKRGLIRLNNQILSVFDKDLTWLYTPEEFKRYYDKHQAWPSIEKLWNRIIIVLMSFHYESEAAFKALPHKLQEYLKKTGTSLGLPSMETRITYQKGTIESKKIKQICFVAFNPEDLGKKDYKDQIIALKTECPPRFVTLHPPDNYEEYWRNGVIVRANYANETPDYINFPATDHWRDKKYREATNWVI